MAMKAKKDGDNNIGTQDVVNEEIVKKKDFGDHDSILCHSVTAGGWGIIGPKTNAYYHFDHFGDSMDIEYADLVQLVRGKSEHIFEPRIMVDDKDFLALFPQVTERYNSLFSKGDLKAILDLPADKMVVEIEKLPNGVKDTLKSMAATMVAEGKIDSISTVAALTKVFGVDFNLVKDLKGE